MLSALQGTWLLGTGWSSSLLQGWELVPSAPWVCLLAPGGLAGKASEVVCPASAALQSCCTLSLPAASSARLRSAMECACSEPAWPFGCAWQRSAMECACSEPAWLFGCAWQLSWRA